MRKRTWEEQRRVDQQNWYDEMHTTQVKLKLNQKTDADILDWLWKQRCDRNTSMQGEIKRLIREEIARGKNIKNRRCTPTEIRANFRFIRRNRTGKRLQYKRTG